MGTKLIDPIIPGLRFSYIRIGITHRAVALEHIGNPYLGIRGFLLVLQLTGGNISRAAQFAGRYRADFYKMLRKYGLHPSTTKGRPDSDMEEFESEANLTEAER